MSKYTTEVRFICETLAGYDESQGLGEVEAIILAAAPQIFGEYPIFDEEYRETLESKILRHYYTREISEETVALWKLRLNDKMNIIMPYYNKLYKSELLTFNPFYDTDLTRDYRKDDTGMQSDLENSNESEKVKKSVSEIGMETGAEKGTELHQGNESESGTEIESAAGKAKGKGSNVNAFAESNVGKDERTGNVSGTQKSTGSSVESGSTTNSDWDLYNDTPQGGVNGLAAIGTSPNDTGTGYLTNARHTFGDENSSRNSLNVGDVKNDSEESSVGKREDNKIGNSSDSFENENESNTVKNKGNSKVVSRDGGRNIDKSNVKESSKSGVGDDSREKKGQKSGESVISNLSQYIEHVIGKQGTASYSKMLMEFRDTFLNIDKMIIKELEPLFFGLWE